MRPWFSAIATLSGEDIVDSSNIFHLPREIRLRYFPPWPLLAIPRPLIPSSATLVLESLHNLRVFVGCLGVIAATFVCPLDVIKTRLQVHGLPNIPNGNFRGGVIFTSLRHIFHKEGVRGMYRGLFPTILALLPNWAIYFTMYEQIKTWLSSDGKNKQLSLGANVIAAASAGVATTVAINPLWVVKKRFQTQGLKTTTKTYKGTLSALRRIAHKEGFRWLYSGLVPALAGVGHVAIQLVPCI